jgi:hypothetical protein
MMESMGLIAPLPTILILVTILGRMDIASSMLVWARLSN